MVTLQRRSVPTSGPRRLDCCDSVWLLGSRTARAGRYQRVQRPSADVLLELAA